MCDIEICLNCSLFEGFLILSHTHMSQDASSNLTSLWSNSCALQHWGPMRWSKSSRMGPFHSMGGSVPFQHQAIAGDSIAHPCFCRAFCSDSWDVKKPSCWVLRYLEAGIQHKMSSIYYPKLKGIPGQNSIFFDRENENQPLNDILSIMGYRGITQTRALHALCCSGFYQTRGAKPQISTEPDDL